MKTKTFSFDSDDKWTLGKRENRVTPIIKTDHGFEVDDRKTRSEVCEETRAFASKLKPIPGQKIIVVSSFGCKEYWGENRKGDCFPIAGIEGRLPDDLDRSVYARVKLPKEWGISTFPSKFDSNGVQIGGGNTFFEHINDAKKFMGKPYDPRNRLDPRCGYILGAFFNRIMWRVEIIQTVFQHKLAAICRDIDAGIPVGISMGCDLPCDRCDICNHLSFSDTDQCIHIKDKGARRIILPNGDVYRMNNDITVYYDNTITAKPAAPEGRSIPREYTKNKSASMDSFYPATDKFVSDEVYQWGNDGFEVVSKTASLTFNQLEESIQDAILTESVKKQFDFISFNPKNKTAAGRNIAEDEWTNKLDNLKLRRHGDNHHAAEIELNSLVKGYANEIRDAAKKHHSIFDFTTEGNNFKKAIHNIHQPFLESELRAKGKEFREKYPHLTIPELNRRTELDYLRRNEKGLPRSVLHSLRSIPLKEIISYMTLFGISPTGTDIAHLLFNMDNHEAIRAGHEADKAYSLMHSREPKIDLDGIKKLSITINIDGDSNSLLSESKFSKLIDSVKPFIHDKSYIPKFRENRTLNKTASNHVDASGNLDKLSINAQAILLARILSEPDLAGKTLSLLKSPYVIYQLSKLGIIPKDVDITMLPIYPEISKNFIDKMYQGRSDFFS